MSFGIKPTESQKNELRAGIARLIAPILGSSKRSSKQLSLAYCGGTYLTAWPMLAMVAAIATAEKKRTRIVTVVMFLGII